MKGTHWNNYVFSLAITQKLMQKILYSNTKIIDMYYDKANRPMSNGTPNLRLQHAIIESKLLEVVQNVGKMKWWG